mgnify:CR=1 FL=1
MKLKKRLSTKQFILSQLLIFTFGLFFLAGLYYILNIQHRNNQTLFENGPVTSLPKTLRLELQQPDNDTLTYQSSIIVSGKTSPFLDVLIYSDSENIVIKAKSDGSFSTVFNLDEDLNQITVVVFDQTGDLKSDTRTVFYSEEKL